MLIDTIVGFYAFFKTDLIYFVIVIVFSGRHLSHVVGDVIPDVAAEVSQLGQQLVNLVPSSLAAILLNLTVQESNLKLEKIKNIISNK
jgi:hypothetical protein